MFNDKPTRFCEVDVFEVIGKATPSDLRALNCTDSLDVCLDDYGK